MAESHVISGLAAKRSEVAGYILKYEQQIAELRCDLAHLDATIKLFDPEFNLRGIRAKEIRQMLGDKYTTLNDYVLVFEKLGAARMIASILRADHGEHEASLDADRLSTEVNEAFAAMQEQNKK